MRMVVVSNRLPVVLEREGETWRVRPGAGGLVTGARPDSAPGRGGLWIGWAGVTADESAGIDTYLAEYNGAAGFAVVPVPLTAKEVDGFYHGSERDHLAALSRPADALQLRPGVLTAYREVQGKSPTSFGSKSGSGTSSGCMITT